MKAFCWLTVSAVALMTAGAAQAQTTDTTTDPTTAAKADDSASDPSSQIVVTAERRSTSLQRTGVAATVLTGQDLVKKSINGVEQLQFATPSLTVNTTGQGNAFNIRGIGKTEQTSAIGVGVVTYRDGVATLPGYFQAEPYYDIASVEVLRGPQGTFAGGNATGGAVFITEKNPDTQSVNGYGLAQYGNYNDIKLQGAVNVPVSDTLAFRFAGNMERRDTFYNMSGSWTGNPGDRRDYSGRASMLWQPSSNFRLLLKGDYNNIEYGGLPASPATATGDPLNVASNAYLAGRDEFGRIVLNMAYTTDSGLTFRSISGFQRGTTQINYDADGTGAAGTAAAPSLTFRDKITEEIWSQEFNIVSPDTGPFTWVLGGYYQSDKIFIPANGGYYSDATPNTPAALDIEIVGTNPKTALAAFGQVGYELTDGLQITVGGRWSRTSSANDAVARAYFTGLPGPLASLPQKDKTVNKKLNGKVAINWTLDPRNFVYAFVATGSKAGGLNGPNLAGVAPLAFDAEDVTDFELGWKGTFMDGHLRTQLGGYYNLYKNFQINIVDPRSPGISSLFNVPGDTKLYGLEASAQGNFDAFSFDFSASVSNSKLSKFYAADPRLGAVPALCNPSTGPASARCINLEGREQNYAPKFTLSAGAQYAISLGGDATLTPRVDYAHIGQVWGTLFQNVARGDRIEARDIVNAQLTLATGNWSIAAYSMNLTDEHYVAAINGTRRLAGAPRQYGVRVSRSF
ncbi:TonB-dependent receptor plug domain-containing protein [Sphingomonas sp. R-74633]|uniref:TonB-dependent receptor n=1 Tax=Sphingomonas sp. R-74633 TaxID=2751188 RepID=UPI0015D0EB08|nr:TonB-dependent receptor plug domain-containing protein [Sphingomonas sp. R-74633]NYT41797.1 TonB-dependent receptor plug domain-containing protein [Sphingomonas sp. R-74633]